METQIFVIIVVTVFFGILTFVGKRVIKDIKYNGETNTNEAYLFLFLNNKMKYKSLTFRGIAWFIYFFICFVTGLVLELNFLVFASLAMFLFSTFLIINGQRFMKKSEKFQKHLDVNDTAANDIWKKHWKEFGKTYFY